MARYVPHTPEELQEMLKTVGVASLDELYVDVPAEIKIDGLNFKEGKSLLEVQQLMENLASGNMAPAIVLRGAGAYQHFIPPLCKTVPAKESFLTAYTPYQAEVSQGILQNIFEFQSMIAELTGMDIANASLYDGAQACAEASAMCIDKKRTKTIVASTINPRYMATIKAYADGRGDELVVLETREGKLDLEALETLLEDENMASCIVQQPNFYGELEDIAAISALLEKSKARFILCVNPLAQSLYASAGELGADIAVGEGQPLGMPLSFGGPYLGFLACKSELMRKVPGRIVGETVDVHGERSFVLTIQTREQHIRREKATSNICTNQALCALTASVYMASMGPEGMQEVASHCYLNAHKLAERLVTYEGFDLLTQGEYFHEFTTTRPDFYPELEAFMCDRKILPGLDLGDKVLWCATEVFTEEFEKEFFEELDAYYEFREQLQRAAKGDLGDFDALMNLMSQGALDQQEAQ